MTTEILVLPIGEVEAGVLAHLCAALSETFGQPCRLGPALPVPDEAFNPRRRQYAAGAILAQLRPGQTERVLGVVDLDLYVPELNFVFGLARLRERFYGKPDNEALFLTRAVKEAVHELGHTYGLGHCLDRRCVMAFSNSLADTDYKGRTFCPRHERELRR